MSATDEIKSRLDIVDFVSENGVKLRKSGRNYTGFCPFHANKRTPAFVVWPETGTWRCFGECNEGGDIFKFLMKKEGIDFREALTRLAARAGVELPAYTRTTPEQIEAYDHLRKLLEDALIFYRSHLQANPDLLDYLHHKRGLTDATLETFGLGYAPDSWDSTLVHFSQRGYSEVDLNEAGLLYQREDGKTHDRFHNRIMIPIRDENGRMAGFGARMIDPQDMPKFLNSPDTSIFTKGRLLYGLDRARKPIRSADQAVIVEGYLDVIALHQAGFENVVSPMGTALTEDQLRLLKRFSRRIVLALDPDAAGQKAVLRGLEAARQAMDREGELGFDAQGLLRSEARLQADLRVAELPEGLDPDEIVARDKEEWQNIIASAKPVVTHVMNALALGRDLKDPKIKNEISVQVLPLINDLPNPVERDTYRQQLARLLRVDERAFTASPTPAVRRGRSRKQTSPPIEPGLAVPGSPVHKIESFCLGMLYRKPELLFRLDRKLQEYGLTPLAAEDFGYTEHQLFFSILRQAVDQDESEHQAYLSAQIPETLVSLSQDLLKRTDGLDPVDAKNLEEILRGVIKLRKLRMNENLNQLRYLQEEAQQEGDLRAASYADLVLQHTRLLRDLDLAHQMIYVKRLE